MTSVKELMKYLVTCDFNSKMGRDYIEDALNSFKEEILESDPRRIPFLLDTDTYKTNHFKMYPESQAMTAYFTFRGPLNNDDERIVFFGMRYLFETIISHQVQQFEITEARNYLKTHGVLKTPMDWPEHLWQRIVDSGGYLPLKIFSLRDGSVVYPQIPCFFITAENDSLNHSEFSYLVTWLETALMRLWSPSVTATKSRHVWNLLKEAFEETVEPEFNFLLGSRLHDFGSRGVSSAETAMTTGVGHLLSFEGTDTMTAGYLATKWNNNLPIGESVLASEHSVMTSWPREIEAVEHLIDITPEGSILSCVADSYNYSGAESDSFLWTILPKIAKKVLKKNITFVVRPDSGSPVKAVLDGLEACAVSFGYTINRLGYKVLKNSAVIQGDGIDLDTLESIVFAVKNAGYSLQNVAFGMGGGLLQKQNRDTLRAAIKLCHIKYSDGTTKDVMKKPSGDLSKASLPGFTKVLESDGGLKIYPANSLNESSKLELIWSSGPVSYKFETFQQMRERLDREWSIRPKHYNVMSEIMLEKIKDIANKIS